MANRIYFASFISDRGDDFFDHFDEAYNGLLAEQEAGTCIFHALINNDGTVIGLFNLRDLQDGSAVLGYRVAQDAAGRGVATATLRKLCQVAAEHYVLHTLRAATNLDNVASQKVLTKAGFVPDGPADLAAVGGRPGIWYPRRLPVHSHLHRRWAGSGLANAALFEEPLLPASSAVRLHSLPVMDHPVALSHNRDVTAFFLKPTREETRCASEW